MGGSFRIDQRVDKRSPSSRRSSRLPHLRRLCPTLEYNRNMGEGDSEQKAIPEWKKNLEQLYPKEIYGDEELFNEDGVDLTGVRAFLDKTPAERLRIAQDFMKSVQKIRELNGRV